MSRRWEYKRILFLSPSDNLREDSINFERILSVDIAPNETQFFESNYPIVMTDRDSLSVEVIPPDAGGSGIGSVVNFMVNGDTESNP